MKKKYEQSEETSGTGKVNEFTFTYKVEDPKTKLPLYTAERLQRQAGQAIEDFENGLCIPHEEIKRKKG